MEQNIIYEMKFSECILTIDNLKYLLKQLINYEIDLTKVISFPVLPFCHTLQTLLIPGFFSLFFRPPSLSLAKRNQSFATASISLSVALPVSLFLRTVSKD